MSYLLQKSNKKNNYINFFNFRKNKGKNNLVEENKNNTKIEKKNLYNVKEIKWIEVYGYKGLNKDMCANIIQESIIPYRIRQPYALDSNNIITNFKGFHLSSELNGTFEKYDPLKHCRYFKVKATVDEKEWNLIKSKKTVKDNIAAKKIELLEEIFIDYKSFISSYDFYRYNKESRLENIFPTEEKWLVFYNSNIDLHQYTINENKNILKNSRCNFSDSMIKIILNKLEDITINKYKNIEDLEKNILIYIYVRRIIDLVLIDKISKETILKLLCNKTLF